jgi:hypothetical protein
MPTSPTILEQDEIPGEPSSAVVREYSLETVSEMREDFLRAAPSEGSPCVVGVSGVGQLWTSDSHLGFGNTRLCL